MPTGAQWGQAVLGLMIAVTAWLNRRKWEKVHYLVNNRLSASESEKNELRAHAEATFRVGDPPIPSPHSEPPADAPNVDEP